MKLDRYRQRVLFVSINLLFISVSRVRIALQY